MSGCRHEQTRSGPNDPGGGATAEIAGQIKALAKSDERHIQDAQFRALRSGEAGEAGKGKA